MKPYHLFSRLFLYFGSRGWRSGLSWAAALAIMLPGGYSFFRPLDTAPTPFTRDPLIAGILAEVTSEQLLRHSAVLTGAESAVIGGQVETVLNRNTFGTEIETALQYAREVFQSSSLETGDFYWDWVPYPAPVLIADQPGTAGESCLYLITAHLDNKPDADIAPGADDNASGAAAVLSAAQILSRYPFGCSLRYILFTGEEQGMLGSQAYAGWLSSQGIAIQGVINLDMIAYDEILYPIMDIHTRSTVSGSDELALAFTQVVSAYGLNLMPYILVDDSLGSYSDNSSFWAHGYPAILVIEDNDDFSVYYHTAADTIHTYNMPYFVEMSRAAIGTLAHLAGLEQGQLSGEIRAADAAPIAGAQLWIEGESGLGWAASSNAEGQYSVELPAGSYTMIASASGFASRQLSGALVEAGLITQVDIDLAESRYLYLPAILFPGETVR